MCLQKLKSLIENNHNFLRFENFRSPFSNVKYRAIISHELTRNLIGQMKADDWWLQKLEASRIQVLVDELNFRKSSYSLKLNSQKKLAVA